jgi:hypothetical protein
MTQERSRSTNEADAFQSEHERRVAEIEEERGVRLESGDADLDEGGRPSSREDHTADMSADDEADADVVGDHRSSPGQNSDRLPQ